MTASDTVSSVDNFEDDVHNVFQTTGIAVFPIVQATDTFTSGEAVPQIVENTDVVLAVDVLIGQATNLTSSDVESI